MLRYAAIIDQLTLDEKASLMSGANFWNTKAVERLGIPSIMLTDGPHGLRKQGGKADHLGLNASIPATCFPTAATLANSWDETLVREVGEYIGREATAEGVSVLLGPGLNIVRDPLAGRNFEYYSEDPYLTGTLAAGFVKGVQSQGIAASPKHFAVNSQEHMRMSIDEVVDERSLHEIYLEGFRRVVQEARPGTVMTAYNKVNGVFANEHPYLLQDILYDTWGFDGVAVTDWGGNNDRVAGLVAGNQLEMPSTNGITDREIVAAVDEGTLDESVLDERVDSLLRLVFETTDARDNKPVIDYVAHHHKAIDAARRSMVLLKNDDHILPLKPRARVAILGDFAKGSRYQGAGSSLVKPTQLDNVYDTLSATDLEIVGYAQGFKRFGGTSARLVRKAVRLAKQADVVLLFLGLDEAAEAEGLDRPSMKLSKGQLELVDAVNAVHDDVVVVLCGGSPIELPFAGKVKAIVHGYLGGQGGGQAATDILVGKHNPSGKLAVTYPVQYSDAPSAPYFPGQEATAEHREGLYFGYRYYDTKGVPVLFPFGYGLSYTTFRYSDIEVGQQQVSCVVENTGPVAGEEIVQVYIRPLTSTVFRPHKELKGFAKVWLEPGQLKRVSIALDDHAFAYYNTQVHGWVVEGGEYDIELGSSVVDIRLSHTLTVVGDDAPNPYDRRTFAAYYAADVQRVGDDEFVALLGAPLPSARWDRAKPLSLDDTIVQLRYKNIIGRALYGILVGTRKVLLALHNPILANNVMFIINMPFRKIEGFSGGKVSEKAVRRFLRLVN